MLDFLQGLLWNLYSCLFQVLIEVGLLVWGISRLARRDPAGAFVAVAMLISLSRYIIQPLVARLATPIIDPSNPLIWRTIWMFLGLLDGSVLLLLALAAFRRPASARPLAVPILPVHPTPAPPPMPAVCHPTHSETIRFAAAAAPAAGAAPVQPVAAGVAAVPTRMITPLYVGLYLASLLISLPLTLGPIIGSEFGPIEEEHLPFVLVGSFVSLGAFAVILVMTYRMWSIFPRGTTNVTPGKAVGFLCIPLFNLYWLFVAHWGWTRQYNRYTQPWRDRVPSAWEGLALAVIIIGVVSTPIGFIAGLAGVPIIGVIVASPNYILMPLFVYHVCSRVNAVAREAAMGTISIPAPTAVPSGPVRGSGGLGIAALVVGICSIVIPYLGLILGIVGWILASIARKRGKDGISLAGLITSIVGTAIWTLIFGCLFVFFMGV